MMARDKKIDNQTVWKEYEKGIDFKARINLYETVKDNENFFIGKQWEGVASNGLPTPVFNFIKRVALFTVASIASGNVKMQAVPFAGDGSVDTTLVTNVLNSEFDRLFEQNKVVSLFREVCRNAAVDGDGCTYTYWDPDVETGQPSKGAIVTEVIENTRIHFGNANDRRVQKQPYIIIEKREMVDEVRERAKENGVADWEAISPDTDNKLTDSPFITDDKVTVLLRLWRNKETGTIWAIETTKDSVVRKPWDTGLKLYPVTWLNWDYVQDCYHGQAMVTGLIPNQVFVNKAYAMTMLSLMTTAFPKIVYDKNRIRKWDNAIGVAVGVNGGDVNNVAKTIDPAPVSPQISQFIQMAEDDTRACMGATSVALGEGKAYNTSAIVALQKAAATPHEITRQNLYQCIEDLGRIYIDFMAEYYGERYLPVPKEAEEAIEFAQIEAPKFDYSVLKNMHFSIKIDVGASAYWSEIASVNTLDNLLTLGVIDVVDYLERVPEGYIIKKQELIDKMKAQMAQAQMQAPQPQPQGGDEINAQPADIGEQNYLRIASQFQ
jgi:hypothetical protein